MRKLLLPILLLAVLVGACAHQQRAKYNTLSAVAKEVDLAEDSYNVAYLQGKVSTNNFPAVQNLYKEFQAQLLEEYHAARFQSNNLAPISLSVKAAAFTKAVADEIKKGSH